MNWQKISTFIPSAALMLCFLIELAASRARDRRFVSRAMAGVFIVVAVSIALYGSGFDSSTHAGWSARLGLFGMKIKAMVCGVGAVMIYRISISAILPILMGLLYLSAISFIFTTAAVLS